MKITIDTSQDSKEDIRKVVALLSNFLNSGESSFIGSSSGVFPEPISECGFFGGDSDNGIGLENNSGANTAATASTSSINSLSNNNNLSVSNTTLQQTQEQQMPFINIFGDEGNAGAGNTNSGSNVLSNNNSGLNNNNNAVGNNLGNATSVSSQTSSAPDIFSVFGNTNNNNNNNQNNSGGIGANYNNIGVGGNNLGSSRQASPKKTFAGIFKGIPILGNLSFGQDDQNEELTEEEKEASKKVVEY
ncbi:hypothetical protein HYU06_07455 [Candidatus Woesearchaeota archaeon]|nr:hypothetical protein [Candidatus Woesearchaeota archaeon]